MKGLRVHGNREANEQLQHCVNSLTRPSTRKSKREEFVRVGPLSGHPTLSLCHFLSGVTESWWRGCKVAGGGFVMQPCYVMLDCGQLQGWLQPGCWVEGTDNQHD